MPSHDSWLLLESAKIVVYDVDRESNRELIVVELGSGSGYVTVSLLKMFPPKSFYAIMVDLDPRAVYSSWSTARANNVDMVVDVVQCDAATCLRRGVADFVYFNPPYLPVCDGDTHSIAWDGGEDGLEVWNKFFEGSIYICKEVCRIVFILSSLQNLDKMFRKVFQSCSRIEVVECQFFFFEAICGVVVECPQSR